MVSMKDISAVCGVSVATVSKALNDHKDIGEETKKQIRQVAKEMGYSPNAAAKTLKTNRTYNIGVLFMDAAHSGLTHDYFAHILDSFKNTAEKKGYDITFINGNRGRQQRMTYLEHSRYRRFDGVVIACIEVDDPEVDELVKSEIPVVTIDYLFNNRSTIVSDNNTGIADLVKYAYKMGHRKIAYIHGDDTGVTTARLASFYKTCEEFGIDVPPEYIGSAPYRNIERASKETERLLDLPNPPTCILYPDDYSSFGGISQIHARGLKIPDDISIIGYDGISIARHYEPQLTTLVQDTERIGREAAEKLVNLIESPKTTLNELIVIPGKLLEGQTVAELK